jgi:U3 small nucleolar RNA-associated protein MPP10
MMDPALSSSSLGDILASIDVSPEIFLQPSASLQAASLVAAKRILDPVVPEYSVFHELALKGLDVEQVWEQVRLVGDEIKRILDKEAGLKGLLRKATNGNGNHHDHEDNSSESETDYEEEYAEEEDQSEEDGVSDGEENQDEDIVDDEDASANDEESVTADEFPTNPELDEESDEEVDSATTSQPKQFKKDVHGLNDEFFSIDDFNRLTEQQDNSRSDDENEDDIDYFGGTIVYETG